MNIYIGNLDFKVDENDLRGLFEEYGSVKDSKIIVDQFNGRSKGFGFVVMEDESEAKNAISELHGSSLEDRTIVVNEAKPRKKF
ncbi:MAG: RNA-binding protein [Marinilabiliales bacterium]|nr:MAG: RNA-binding protein [Marinilabiliales bacterium]